MRKTPDEWTAKPWQLKYWLQGLPSGYQHLETALPCANLLCFSCQNRSSHLCYTSQVISQSRTRVKLNRVFFPPDYQVPLAVVSIVGREKLTGFPSTHLCRLFDLLEVSKRPKSKQPNQHWTLQNQQLHTQLGSNPLVGLPIVFSATRHTKRENGCCGSHPAHPGTCRRAANPLPASR